MITYTEQSSDETHGTGVGRGVFLLSYLYRRWIAQYREVRVAWYICYYHFCLCQGMSQWISIILGQSADAATSAWRAIHGLLRASLQLLAGCYMYPFLEQYCLVNNRTFADDALYEMASIN